MQIRIAPILAGSILVLSLSLPSFAQTYQGAVRGLVTDASGAVVPDAKVVLTNEAQHISRAAESDGAGQYSFPAVDPGTYTVDVEKSGFVHYKRTGVAVVTQATTTVDVALAIGNVTQSVEVTAASVPLLNTADASVSTTLSEQVVNDVPYPSVDGRSIYTSSTVSPMVLPTQNITAGAADLSNVSTMTVAGSPPQTNQYLVDGVPITDIQQRPIYSPNVEAVQESKTMIMDYDAEMGRTAGGTWDTILESGTNVLHGSLYGTTNQGNWNANSFFNNRNNVPRPNSPAYLYAGSLGGPLLIPHIYNGKDRTFWFISEEGYRNNNNSTGSFAVPTALEKTGDFSDSYNSSGVLDTIYDPTSCPNGTSACTRKSFISEYGTNKIPGGMISTVGQNIANIYPSAPAGSITASTNYTHTGYSQARGDEMVSKLDQQLRSWWLANVSYVHGGWLIPETNTLGVISNTGGRSNYRHVDATTVNNTFTIGPRTVLAVRFGFNRFPTKNLMTSYGYSPTNLGFPNYNYQQLFFPAQTLTGFTELGLAGSTFENYYSRNLVVSASHFVGRHTLKVGFEQRSIYMAFQDNNYSAGAYSYSGIFTQANPLGSAGGTGSAVADLLLGLPISGTIARSIYLYNHIRYFAGYLQDDFRVNPKLTLNLGLRYEYETGLKEANNNNTIGFSPTATTPLSQASAPLIGGLEFAGNGVTECCDWGKKKFAPRLGFSYGVLPKTLVRGGFGILYAPFRYDANSALETGYDIQTPLTSTNNAGQSAAAGFSLSNPFPNGAAQPTGSSAGLLTGLGTNISGYGMGLKSAYVERFSIDVQRELPGGVMVDVGYVGSRGRHLIPAPEGVGATGTSTDATNINQLNPSNFSLGSAYLTTTVSNPYYTAYGTGQPTVTRQQLLLPFPQFLSVNLILTNASAEYNAFAVSAEKHMTKDLSFQAAFVASTNMDNMYAATNPGPQNLYNLAAEWGYSTLNVTRRANGLMSYHLPMGHGEKYFNSNWWEDVALGGWSSALIGTIQTGMPLSIIQTDTNSAIGAESQRPNLTGTAIATSGSLYNRLSGYLNSSAFSTVSAYQFGNAPRTINSVRTPGRIDWDLSAIKEFHIGERVGARFEAQAFNLLNTPYFGNPGENVSTSSSFGKITSTTTGGRTIKMGGRITF